MAHAFSRGCGDASDITHHRFFHMMLNIFSGFFFGTTTDLAHHDDAFGLPVLFEHFQTIDKVSTLNRVTTNAHTSTLPQTIERRLIHRFVGQRAGARDNTDGAFFMNHSGHDANLAFIGSDNARTVRANQMHVTALERCFHFDHIQHRNAFGNARNNSDACIGSFQNRIGGKGCGYKNHTGICLCFCHCVFYCVKHWAFQMRLPTFARCNTAHKICAVRNRLF